MERAESQASGGSDQGDGKQSPTVLRAGRTGPERTPKLWETRGQALLEAAGWWFHLMNWGCSGIKTSVLITFLQENLRRV